MAVVFLVPISFVKAQNPQKKPLDIYFIDTEGGQATLFVTPAGESMLVDTGFPGNQGAATAMRRRTLPDHTRRGPHHGGIETGKCDRARLRGDYALSRRSRRQRGRVGPPDSHPAFCGPRPLYSGDGGNPGCALSVLSTDSRDGPHNRAETRRPDSRRGFDVQVVSAAGNVITKPMQGAPGAGAANPLCRDAKLKEQDVAPENFESIGIVVRYGSFRLLDLGDLTWNQEHALACPNNLIGTFTVFHTTRHGDPHSGAPQMVHAIRARVAVMNNGERKGGSPEYWQTVHEAPGLEDFWQLHRSAEGGTDHNSPEQFLANINETDHGHNIKMSVRADGSFTMTNERTGFTKDYPVR